VESASMGSTCIGSSAGAVLMRVFLLESGRGSSFKPAAETARARQAYRRSGQGQADNKLCRGLAGADVPARIDDLSAHDRAEMQVRRRMPLAMRVITLYAWND
jgi:hypothetical protein